MSPSRIDPIFSMQKISWVVLVCEKAKAACKADENPFQCRRWGREADVELHAALLAAPRAAGLLPTQQGALPLPVQARRLLSLHRLVFSWAFSRFFVDFWI